MALPLTNAVARGTRPAMQLIYDLRECGVEREIAIPQVAVIGDQSSGKVRSMLTRFVALSAVEETQIANCL